MSNARLSKRLTSSFRFGARRGLMISCICGVIVVSGIAGATPPSGFHTTFVGPTLFDEIDINLHTDGFKVKIDTKQPADVYVVTNSVDPGGYSGWHTHPGPSLVSVKAGTATYYDGDDPYCTPHVVPPGEGFIDPGGGHVHMVRNEGTVELELVAFQIIPVDAGRRVDADRPGNCPF